MIGSVENRADARLTPVVLSNDLWTEIRKRARASKSRKGAIAYATLDLVGFRESDTLVVDASARTIQNGEPMRGCCVNCIRKACRFMTALTCTPKFSCWMTWPSSAQEICR